MAKERFRIADTWRALASSTVVVVDSSGNTVTGNAALMRMADIVVELMKFCYYPVGPVAVVGVAGCWRCWALRHFLLAHCSSSLLGSRDLDFRVFSCASPAQNLREMIVPEKSQFRLGAYCGPREKLRLSKSNSNDSSALVLLMSVITSKQWQYVF
jgi:hypothetical protein